MTINHGPNHGSEQTPDGSQTAGPNAGAAGRAGAAGTARTARGGQVLLFGSLGTLFGFVLSRSGAADYDFIQGMFLFTEFQLYGILATGVGIAAVGLALLRRRGTVRGGEPIRIRPKPLHRGTVVGGALFGIGWSLTGMCPGPILVNLGEGKVYALGAFAGVLTGAYVFGARYESFRARLGLPELPAQSRKGS